MCWYLLIYVKNCVSPTDAWLAERPHSEIHRRLYWCTKPVYSEWILSERQFAGVQKSFLFIWFLLSCVLSCSVLTSLDKFGFVQETLNLATCNATFEQYQVWLKSSFKCKLYTVSDMAKIYQSRKEHSWTRWLTPVRLNCENVTNQVAYKNAKMRCWLFQCSNIKI